MTDDYTTDAGLEAGGWAAGRDVWDVIKNAYGDVLGDDELAEGQLQSLKRAILAEHAVRLHSGLSGELEAAGSSGRPENPEPALGRHEDRRGVIADLLGRVDGVTEIVTWEGGVRGNHVHRETTQWTYVVAGMLLVAWIEDDGVHTARYGQGSLITEAAGIPHAWKALLDTRVLVFTKGPRSGESYESDTMRLAEKDWLLR